MGRLFWHGRGFFLKSSFFSSCLPSTRSLPDCTETFNSSGLYSEASILTSILELSSSTLASSLLNKLLNSLNWLSRFLLGTIQSSFHLLLKKELSKELLMLNGEKVLMLRAIFSSLVFCLAWLFSLRFSLLNSPC